MNPDLIARLRNETPGCRNVLHFNNAGAALMPRPMVDAVLDYTRLESEIGGYEAARREAARIEGVYASVARLVGAEAHEIAITQNATQAWDAAFYAIPFRPGDRILTSMAEYASNYLAFLQVCKRTGAVVEPVPNDESGQLCVESLRTMMNDGRVRLIAVTHIPTNGGLVNPAAEIGTIAREHQALYLLDACQSAGQLPLDVAALGCDMLSATSRKYLRGPRGMGFLYVRESLIEQLEPMVIDLHAATWTGRDSYRIRPDARRFESWETNYAAKIGFGVAVEYALALGLENIWSRVRFLADALRRELGEIPGVRVRDLGRERCGIVSFSVENHASESVFRALESLKINVSYSVFESTRLDMEARNLTGGVVRASVHYYNTEAEIARFCEALRKLLRN